MWFLYVIIIGLVVFQFLVAPLLAYWQIKLPAAEVWTEWDMEDGTKTKVAERAKKSIAGELAPLGFESVGAIKARTEAIDAYEVHCGHDNGTDRVSVATMYLKTLKQKKTFIEFVTDFSDGSQIATSNSDLPALVFISRPGCHGFRFPEIQDIALLFRMHQVGVERYGSATAKTPWRAQSLVDHRNAAETNVVQHQVACGRLKQNADGTMSPTLRGAFQMTWRAAIPFRQVRRAMHNHKRQQLRKNLPASR